MFLKNKISPIYEKVMNKSLLETKIPTEEFANCMDCQHCVNKFSPRAQTKCCDYHPLLPNYVVGAILSDTSANTNEGRERITTKIKNEIGITPYGIMAPLEYYKLYQKSRKHKNLDNDANINDLLCPYYNNGLCTIWDYRSELCASFHCSSNGGSAGDQFWKIFYQYLTKIEFSLSIYIMKELGYPVNKLRIERVTPDSPKIDKGKSIDKEVYDSIWDRWEGREMDFYKSCHSTFKNITPERYKKIIGQDGLILEEKLYYKSKEFLNNVAPELIIFDQDKFQIELLDDDTLRVAKVKMHAIQYGFLKLFDGKTKTYDVVRKSMIMQVSIASLLTPLIKAGVLKHVG